MDELYQQMPGPRPLILLPQQALDGHSNSAGYATPRSAVCTPHNAKSTQWRTLVCPHPPVKMHPSSAGGLTSPANNWPTPAATPVGTPRAGNWTMSQGLIRTTSAPEHMDQTGRLVQGSGRGMNPAALLEHEECCPKALTFTPPHSLSPISPGFCSLGRRRIRSFELPTAVEEDEEDLRQQRADSRRTTGGSSNQQGFAMQGVDLLAEVEDKLMNLKSESRRGSIEASFGLLSDDEGSERPQTPDADAKRRSRGFTPDEKAPLKLRGSCEDQEASVLQRRKTRLLTA